MTELWRIFVFLVFCSTGLCCNTGWSLYEGICYRASEVMYDVVMARRYCQVNLGDLAYVNSSSTLQFLNKLKEFDGQRSYWVEESSALLNTMSSLTTRSSYVTTNTTSAPEVTGCPYAKILDINYDECNERKYFFCEVPEVNSEMECPQGWDLHGSLCFRTMTVQLNYTEADKHCALQHAQLAVLDTVEKESIAQAIIIGKNTSFLVGVKREDGIMKWTNHKDFKPSCGSICRNSTSGDCIVFLSNPEHPLMTSWINVDCSKTFNFMCEMTATPKSTTPSTTPPTTTPLPMVCPHGYNWKPVEDSGYCFWETTYETERLNWYHAREFCQRFGGDLASYDNQEQEKLGVGGALGHYRGLWIGLKRDNNNAFQWSDGTKLVYRNWDYEEPNLKSKSKFCVMHGAGDSQWRLDYCGVRRWFVCKAPKVSIPHIPDTGVLRKTKCNITGTSAYRYQWYLYEDHCYLAHELNKYSWDTAQLFCQDNDGHMASIHSFSETNFILSVVSISPEADFWIGLSSRGLHSSYAWSDGTPLEFIYWNDNISESNDSESINSCVSFDKRDGSWKSDHCNRLQGVICKRPVNASYEFTTPEPTPLLPGNCENGWYTFGNKCYKYFGSKWSKRVKWWEAKHACEEMGAVLVSVHSRSEQEFLTDLILEANTNVWTGLRTMEMRTVFQWCDDSRMDYTNWNANEPDMATDSDEDLPLFGRLNPEVCVEMMYDEDYMGKWNDVTCSKIQAYICQKPKNSSISVPPEDPFICGNITGWYKLGSACYGIFEKDQKLSWVDAQGSCREYDANLVTYKNSAVSIFLSKRIKQKSGYFWAGVRETVENKYSAVNGIPLHYTNWMSGQPYKAGRTMENCVAVTSNGSWIVKNCQEKNFFICEWNPDNYKEPIVETTYACSNSTYNFEDLGGDYCYLFKADLRYTWSDAMHYCFRHGGSLASFHSAKEIDALRNYLIENDFDSLILHIGLGRRRDGSYAWVDNSALDFTFWDEDFQPENAEENCVYMYVPSGKWNDIDCDETHRGFICTAPKKHATAVEPLEANSLPEKENISAKLTAWGIFGIVISCLVIIAVAAVVTYYIWPAKRTLRPRLLEQESL